MEVGLLQRAYPTVQDSFPNATHKTPKRFVMTPSVEKCKDGYIGITLLTGQHWQDFCGMTEMYDWMEDPRFILLPNRLKHKKVFQERFDEWLMRHTQEEIIALAKEWRVPAIPVPTFEDMLSFPQYEERGLFVKVDHPKMGAIVQPGAPFRMSETPWKINSPAPLLGEHTEDVLDGRLGMKSSVLQEMRQEGVI